MTTCTPNTAMIFSGWSSIIKTTPTYGCYGISCPNKYLFRTWIILLSTLLVSNREKPFIVITIMVDNVDVQTANPGNPIFSCDRRFTKDVSSWITQQSEIEKEYCMYSFVVCIL